MTRSVKISVRATINRARGAWAVHLPLDKLAESALVEAAVLERRDHGGEGTPEHDGDAFRKLRERLEGYSQTGCRESPRGVN